MLFPIKIYVISLPTATLPSLLHIILIIPGCW